MGSELMLGGGGFPERRSRPSRGQRAVQRRADVAFAQLVASGNHQEAVALFRKRMTEDGIQDVVDVYRLGDELAAANPGAAGLLAEIVKEFARTTARDIRDFGRRRDL